MNAYVIRFTDYGEYEEENTWIDSVWIDEYQALDYLYDLGFVSDGASAIYGDYFCIPCSRKLDQLIKSDLKLQTLPGWAHIQEFELK